MASIHDKSLNSHSLAHYIVSLVTVPQVNHISAKFISNFLSSCSTDNHNRLYLNPYSSTASDNDMASVLKRKRGAVSVPDSKSSPTPSLKRAKSVENGVETEKKPSAPLFDASKSGWDAAFGAAKKQNELAKMNGNGVIEEDGEEEAEDFEAFVAGQSTQSRQRKARQARQDAKELAGGVAWKASDPIGGRILDIDPVFTQDEKYVESFSICISELTLRGKC